LPSRSRVPLPLPLKRRAVPGNFCCTRPDAFQSSAQLHVPVAGLVPPTHVFDYGELEDARWFTRDWLVSHTDDDSFRMPRLDSIARRLIEDWLHER